MIRMTLTVLALAAAQPGLALADARSEVSAPNSVSNATPKAVQTPAAAVPVAPAPAPTLGPTAHITVTGEGVVHTHPDEAVVTLGVATEGTTAAEAMARNSTRLGEVMAGLSAIGIDARDIQTTGLSLGPRWQDTAGGKPAKIVGFDATDRLTVRVRSLGKLGAVLDTVVKNGANRFSGIRFTLSDPTAKRDEARRKAVADAIARAGVYAKAAGVQLGPLMTITDQGVSSPPVQMMQTGIAAARSAVPVAVGELDVRASVTMVFALR